MSKRRNHDASFKARVVLDPLKGIELFRIWRPFTRCIRR
jgi:hypothetical protein